MLIHWFMARIVWLIRRIRRGPGGDNVLIAGVSEHLEAYFDTKVEVFHEQVSYTVHLDVHVVPPGPGRAHFTLVTSGMAARAMEVPSNLAEVPRHVEMVMLLPPDWRMEKSDFREERWFWPVQHIMMLARAPHEWSTWFGVGHTMQMHEDLKPFAGNTALCAYMLAPEPFGDGFSPLVLPDGREITFLMAVPLYAEELAFARAHGTQALIERFEAADVDRVVDPLRRNLCGKEPKERESPLP
jgi:hypothetical protein